MALKIARDREANISAGKKFSILGSFRCYVSDGQHSGAPSQGTLRLTKSPEKQRMFQGVFTPSSAMLIDSPVETSKQNLLDFFEIISESQKGPVVGWERRNHTRVDYPHPVFLTPLDAKGNPQLDETFGVLGRQISEKGFDFYHKEPIAHKLVIVSFEFSPGRWLGAKLKLNWCRFGRHGYFENGGQFLETVESPFGIGVID